MRHLSTGDMLRADAEAGVPAALAVKEAIAAGRFAPDDLVVAMVAGRISGSAAMHGFVLDGFPRTVAQAIALDTILAESDQPTTVIEIKVDEDRLLERVIRRAEGDRAAGRTVRADDTPQIFVERMNVFHKTTALVITHYLGNGTMKAIDGMKSPAEVHLDILECLE